MFICMHTFLYVILYSHISTRTVFYLTVCIQSLLRLFNVMAGNAVLTAIPVYSELGSMHFSLVCCS